MFASGFPHESEDFDFEQYKMLVSYPIGLFPFPSLFLVLLLCSAARSVTTGECHLAQECLGNRSIQKVFSRERLCVRACMHKHVPAHQNDWL